MERRLVSCRREGIGSRLRLLVFILFPLLLSFFLSGTILAQSTQSERIPIANPAGTTIDIIDYSVYDKVSCSDAQTVRYEYQGHYNDTGINENHTLIFHAYSYDGEEVWNHWSQPRGGVTHDIVKPFLTNDGFPELNCNGTVTQTWPTGDNRPAVATQTLNCVNGAAEESLDYLFKIDLPDDYDPEHDFQQYKEEYFVKKTTEDDACPDKPYWEAFPGVNYLFAVDENGYYTFDSQYDRAIMDEETGIITVDAQPHPNPPTDGSSILFGFYPFNHYRRPGERPPYDSGEHDKSGWFFGAHMQSNFSIPYDYQVQNQNGELQDMIFNFRGDDDVWLFIDGILIGDVGGIHSQHDLKINFKTGEVKVYNNNIDLRYVNLPGAQEEETTVFAMVQKAYEYKYGETLTPEEIWDKLFEDFEWNDDVEPTTFKEGTYHKMDLFYLERGGGGSNLIMQFNLVGSYDFTAHKTLHRGSSEEGAPLGQSQFRYRLTGYPKEYDGKLWEAIMPKKQHDKSVTWDADYTAEKSLIDDPINQDPKTLIVGNSQDGFVNFGGGDLKGSKTESGSEFAQYLDKTFKYIYEELPPKGAVPINGGKYLYRGEEVGPISESEIVGKYIFDNKIYDIANGQQPPVGAVNNEDGSYTYKDKNVKPITAEEAGGVYKFKAITAEEADGTFRFEELVYNLRDPDELPPTGARYQGTYLYNGQEIQMNTDGTYTFDGITYDKSVYYFTGELYLEECAEGSGAGEGETSGEGESSDEGDTCKVESWIARNFYTDYTYQYRESSGSYTNFDNRYDSVGQVELNARKRLLTLNGDELPVERGAYNFILTEQGTDDPYTDSYNPNAADGSVSFDRIIYKTDDLAGETEKDIMYEISEVRGTSNEIDYSEEKYYARVHLKDRGDGSMAVTKQYYRPCEAGSGYDCPEGSDTCQVIDDICYEAIDEEDVTFTNRENVLRGELTVEKKVTGNIGSRNKVFTFTLNMPQMAGKTAEYSINGETPNRTVTFDTEGNAEFNKNDTVFDLKHDDYITFYGINGNYTVTEAESGYSTTWCISDSTNGLCDPEDPEAGTQGQTLTSSGTVTLSDNNVTVTYTNKLEVPPPTGIRDEVRPALVGIAGAGLMLLTLTTGKKRKKYG